uniref:Low density lipoprotein receptor adaptor protein 1 n=1 Tax=Junco hyemalis TaxID=40217 RepID=A0A8C5ICZ2_JUNHY
MDALKSAGRALLRSPSVHKPSWAGGRHKKLPENWTDTRETLLEGMLFSLKYLGMTLVEQPKGEELSAAAVKRIVATVSVPSCPQVALMALGRVPRGEVLVEGTQPGPFVCSRISYCTADRAHDKVFAYIAQSQHSESLECHAFLCPKRKMAQAVTLTVAQAFRLAFEFWQAAKEGELEFVSPLSPLPAGSGSWPLLLCREGEEGKVHPGTLLATTCLSFDLSTKEMDDGLDEAFSRLAQSRTNPQELDTGLSAQEAAEALSPLHWGQLEPSPAEQDDLFMF